MTGPRNYHPRLLVVSLILAVVLTLVPLPTWMDAFRPYWVALVMAYWILESDHLHSLGAAFVIGLSLDFVTGTLLGQHALSLLIWVYLLLVLRPRIRFAPPGRQAFFMLALLLNDRVVQLWILWLAGAGVPGVGYWTSPLVGAALWPWIFLLLDNLRARRRAHRAS